MICATSVRTTIQPYQCFCNMSTCSLWSIQNSAIVFLSREESYPSWNFFPQAAVRYILAGIWNPVKLWDMKTIFKVPLSFSRHCFISALDKWQHFDLFYLTVEHRQSTVMCHYGNCSKYAVVSADHFTTVWLHLSKSPTSLPSCLESIFCGYICTDPTNNCCSNYFLWNNCFWLFPVSETSSMQKKTVQQTAKTSMTAELYDTELFWRRQSESPEKL